MESLNFFDALKEFSKNYNYTISFSGPYTASVLIDFCSTLQSIVENSSEDKDYMPKLIYGISLEMLENIQFHGAEIDNNILGFYGLSIDETSDIGSYRITIINYVHKDNLDNYFQELNYVNNIDLEELNAVYSLRRKKNTVDISKKKGLGLLDIRRKSGMNMFEIKYDKESDDLFIVEVSIKINSTGKYSLLHFSK